MWETSVNLLRSAVCLVVLFRFWPFRQHYLKYKIIKPFVFLRPALLRVVCTITEEHYWLIISTHLNPSDNFARNFINKFLPWKFVKQPFCVCHFDTCLFIIYLIILHYSGVQQHYLFLFTLWEHEITILIGRIALVLVNRFSKVFICTLGL